MDNSIMNNTNKVACRDILCPRYTACYDNKGHAFPHEHNKNCNEKCYIQDYNKEYVKGNCKPITNKTTFYKGKS